MPRLTLKQQAGLCRGLKKKAFAITGRKLDVVFLESNNPIIGATSERGIIFLGEAGKFVGGLELGETISFHNGIFAHEAMHQVMSDFSAIAAHTKKRLMSNGEKLIFHSLHNILEDSAIEYFMPEFIGGHLLTDLDFMRFRIYSILPPIDDGNCKDAYAQYVAAFIQYGDAGLIKGEFTFEDAKNAFHATLDLWEEGLTERDAKKRIKIADRIFRATEHLWRDTADSKTKQQELSDIMGQHGKSDSPSKGGNNGKPLSQPQGNNTRQDSAKQQRRKITVRRITKEEAEEMGLNEQDSGQGGDLPDGDIEILIVEGEEENNPPPEGDGEKLPVPGTGSSSDEGSEQSSNSGTANQPNDGEKGKKAKGANQSNRQNSSKGQTNRQPEQQGSQSGDKADEESADQQGGADSGKSDEDENGNTDASGQADAGGQEDGQSEQRNAAQSGSKAEGEQNDQAGDGNSSEDNNDEQADEAHGSESDDAPHEASGEQGSHADGQLGESSDKDGNSEEEDAGDNQPAGQQGEADAEDNNDGKTKSGSGSSFGSNGYSSEQEDADSSLHEEGNLDPRIIEELINELEELVREAAREEAEKKSNEEKLPIIDTPASGYHDCCKNVTSKNNIVMLSPSEQDALNEAYKSIVRPISPQISMLASQLKRVFRNSHEEKTKKTSGKVNINRLSKGSSSARIFDRRKEPSDRHDMAVFIACDESGSTDGIVIKNIRLAAIGLAETFAALKIPLYVMGFTSRERLDAEHYHYIRWRNTVEDRAKLLTMRSRDYNFDSYAVRYATEILKKRHETNKLLIVISDGYPSAQRYNIAGGNCGVIDTKYAIRDSNKQATTMGILLGNADPAQHREMYGVNFFHITNPDELFQKMSKFVAKLVKGW